MALSGKTGTVTIDSTTFNVVSWSVSINNAIVDVTNTGTSGAQDNVEGISSADLNLTGKMLVGQTVPTAGAIAAVVLGNSAATPSATIYSGNFFIDKVGLKDSVDGAYEFDITGSSTI